MNSDNPKANFPHWFTDPHNQAERELLINFISSDKKLEEIYKTAPTMLLNYHVFRINYLELKSLVERFDTPHTFSTLALQGASGQMMAMNAIVEFTRRLHNYLASTKMLIDVTRSWVRELSVGSSFLLVYNTEVENRFTNNVQAQFLRDLRNYTLHRTLPLATPQLRMEQVDEHHLRSSVAIVLMKEPLLEWGNWSELGRMQLKMEPDDGVDIFNIATLYFKNVTEFSIWLSWQMKEIYSKEVDQINDFMSKLTPMIKKGRKRL